MEYYPLEIKKINFSIEKQLCIFFHDLIQNRDDLFFHPHPFTSEYAKIISYYSGEDLYYVLTEKNAILGYAMLRGWDEGYEIPSLGIIIHYTVRNRGFGKLFMTFLHHAAKMKGAKKIRLKVHPSNKKAIQLYQNLGYVFNDMEKTELIGFYDYRK